MIRFLMALTLAALVLLSLPAAGQIEGGDKYDIVFAQGKVPEGVEWDKRFRLTETGLLFEELPPNTSAEVWLRTQRLPIGLAWRPPSSVRIELSTFGEAPKGFPMTAFVRYGCDAVHWSTWYRLSPRQVAATTALMDWECQLDIPHTARQDYQQRFFQWSREHREFGSDEDAFCRWMAKEEPEFFATEFPFIGYVQFLLENPGLHDQVRITSLTARASWGVGGIHQSPQGRRQFDEGKWHFDIREVEADVRKISAIARDAETLRLYLSTPNPDEKMKRDAHELVGTLQVVELSYERPVPIAGQEDQEELSKFVDGLQTQGAYWAYAMSRHEGGRIFPGIGLTLSSFNENGKAPARWLEMAKAPMERGYVVKDIRIIYAPSEDIKRESFARCQRAIETAAQSLEALKPRFGQLQDFGKDKVTGGEWRGEDWPSYPRISYRFGFGAPMANSKGSYEKTRQDWCEVMLSFKPDSGNPQAMAAPGKSFPRQGLTARWIVQAAGDQAEFKSVALQSISDALTILDDYERELEAAAAD